MFVLLNNKMIIARNFIDYMYYASYTNLNLSHQGWERFKFIKC